MARNVGKKISSGRKTVARNSVSGRFTSTSTNIGVGRISDESNHRTQTEVRSEVRDIINRQISRNDSLWKELAKH